MKRLQHSWYCYLMLTPSLNCFTQGIVRDAALFPSKSSHINFHDKFVCGKSDRKIPPNPLHPRIGRRARQILQHKAKSIQLFQKELFQNTLSEITVKPLKGTL